jgi:hypothetical protein
MFIQKSTEEVMDSSLIWKKALFKILNFINYVYFVLRPEYGLRYQVYVLHDN